MSTAPRFSLHHLVLVVIGGVAGTAARAALMLPDAGEWSALVVPAINVVGAFLLGLVTGHARRFASSERAVRFRMLLGAGALGGFTTYSAFAVQSVALDTATIAVATLVVGTLAGWAGLVLGRPRIRSAPSAEDPAR